eukprot:CAMPEP_0194225030 /NCGR_PEP_ID=MMETSP0156-20130528/38690_1 /TAXON_ID=33649 /ORGANISM="Thalassionema nitzschioides, Strain L26-B" /LENGTH=42 /DNA_ID= /DNA_START= /DNA_END= /DNA_ORIENTATION=
MKDRICPQCTFQQQISSWEGAERQGLSSLAWEVSSQSEIVEK